MHLLVFANGGSVPHFGVSDFWRRLAHDMSASRVDKVMAVDRMARRDKIELEFEDDKYPRSDAKRVYI